ncbi:MAG: Uma2 family endonuclease [Acidobacteria bacterium]|nr:Uma2 family endonuclease [Acidobacteriota bacterium]
MTADEFAQLPDDDHRYELVRGEVRRTPPPRRQRSRIATKIIARLGPWIDERKLGEVYAAVGFLLSQRPDTVRSPDVSFVRAENVPDEDEYPPAPDLAFEVKSPSNTYKELLEKKDDYLAAGTLAVIIVDPTKNSVTVQRPTGVTTVEDTLTLDDILPGWQLPLSDLFA